MKRNADRSKHAKHRQFKTNDPVLHKWERANKYIPLFDPQAYRVIRVNGFMIVAKRINHEVTINIHKFKIISKGCFKKSMAKFKTPTPNQMHSVVIEPEQNDTHPLTPALHSNSMKQSPHPYKAQTQSAPLPDATRETEERVKRRRHLHIK